MQVRIDNVEYTENAVYESTGKVPLGFIPNLSHVNCTIYLDNGDKIRNYSLDLNRVLEFNNIIHKIKQEVIKSIKELND